MLAATFVRLDKAICAFASRGMRFAPQAKAAVCYFSVFSYLSTSTTMVYAATEVIPDGRTQTQVIADGKTLNVHTNTQVNQVGYNSFSQFDVAAGDKVNLHLGSANTLVNMVNGKQSDIQGQVDALKNGQIGGNVYFYNPDGILVGKDGAFNAGSLTLGTPSRDFIESLVSSDGKVDPAVAAQALSRQFPLSGTGVIELQGKIHALNDLYINADNFSQVPGAVKDVAGSVHIYNSVKQDFERLVNLGVDAGQQKLSIDHTGTIVIGTKQAAANVTQNNPSIVASGETKTSITTVAGHSSLVSDVETQSIVGNNAYNAFSQFDVLNGEQVNLHVPAGVNNLINLVKDKESRVDGLLNAYKGGKIGGNLYFLNPYGLVVGKSGVINADRLAVATPSIQSLNGFLSQLRGGDDMFGAIQANTFAKSKAQVNIAGQIHTPSGLSIEAGEILVSGEQAQISTLNQLASAGDISLTANKISLKQGAALKGGDISLTANADASSAVIGIESEKAEITLGKQVDISGKNISLQAQASSKSIAAVGVSSLKSKALVAIGSGSKLTASDSIKIQASAAAKQSEAALLLNSFGTVSAKVVLDGAELTANKGIDIDALAEVNLSTSDYAIDKMPTALPVDFALSVANATAEVSLKNTSLTATNGDIDIFAKSHGQLEAVSTARTNGVNGLVPTLKFGGALAIGVLNNKAQIHMQDSSLTSGRDINASAWAIGLNQTIASVKSDSQSKFSMGLGFNWSLQDSDVTLNGVSAVAGRNINLDNQNILKANLQNSLEIGTDGFSGLTDILDAIASIIKDKVPAVAQEREEKQQACALDAKSAGCKKVTTADLIDDSVKVAQSKVELLESVLGLAGWESGKESNKAQSRTGVALGAQVVSNNSSILVTGTEQRASVLDASSGSIEAKSVNITESNAVVSAQVKSENGSDANTKNNAIAVAATYDQTSNQVLVQGRDNKSVRLSAQSIKLATANKEEDKPVVAGQNLKDVTADFAGIENKRVLNALATKRTIADDGSTEESGAGLQLALGVGVSTRQSHVDLDKADIKVLAGDLELSAQQQIDNIELSSGDSLDEAELVKMATGWAANNLQFDEAANNVLSTIADSQAADEPDGDDSASKGKARAVVAGFNIAITETRANITDSVAINKGGEKLHDLKVSADSSIGSASTRVQGSASGSNGESGTLGLSTGFSLLKDKTQANLAGKAQSIQATGAVTVSANHESDVSVDADTIAPGDGDNDAATMVTLGGSVVLQETKASLDRDVTAKEEVAVTAQSLRRVSSDVKGSSSDSNDAEDEGDGGETDEKTNGLQRVFDWVTASVPKLVSTAADVSRARQENNKNYGDNLNESKVGLTKSIDDAKQNVDEVSTSTPGVDGTEKNGSGDIIVTPGFNVVVTETKASVADARKLVGGDIKIQSLENLDTTVVVESEADSGKKAKALGVAVNVVVNKNLAELGKNTVVASQGDLLVQAGMASNTREYEKKDEDGKVKKDSDGKPVVVTYKEQINSFSAGATSAAGLAEEGAVVGAIAANVVVSETKALVLSGASVNVGDGLTLDSVQNTETKAEASGTVGATGFLLAGDTETKESDVTWLKAVFGGDWDKLGEGTSGLLQKGIDAYSQGDLADKAGESGPSGNGTGVGIAVNTSVLTTESILDSEASAKTIAIKAKTQLASKALGVAGTGPAAPVLSTDSNQPAAKARDGSVAVNITDADTRAIQNQAVTADKVEVAAHSESLTEAKGDSKSAGAEAAHGAAVGINVSNIDTQAELNADVKAGANSATVAVTAVSNSVDRVSSYASARGTPVELYAQKLKGRVSENLILLDAPDKHKDGDLPYSVSQLEKLKSKVGKAEAKLEEVKSKSDSAKKAVEQKKTSQSFAAALSGLITNNDTVAKVAENISVQADKGFTLEAENNAIAKSKATGLAVLSDKGTGAAFDAAIVSNETRAELGRGVRVLDNKQHSQSEEKGISIRALSRFNTGSPAFANQESDFDALNGKQKYQEIVVADQQGQEYQHGFEGVDSDYFVEAVAGAGSKKESRSGAIAIGIQQAKTITLVGANAVLDTDGKAHIGSFDRTQVDGKAWALSVALGKGAKPGEKGSTKGGVASTLFRFKTNKAEIGEAARIAAKGALSVQAQSIKPSAAWVKSTDSDQNSPASFDFATVSRDLLAGDFSSIADIEALKRSEGLANQAIAAAATGSSTDKAFSGALALTFSQASTEVIIADKAQLTGSGLVLEVSNDQDVFSVGGSLAASLGESASGVQSSAVFLLDDSKVSVGTGTVLVSTAQNLDIKATSNTKNLNAVVGAAASKGSGQGTNASLSLGINLLENDTLVDLADGVSITSAKGVELQANGHTESLAISAAVSGTKGKTAIGATLAANVTLNDVKIRVGETSIKALAGDMNAQAGSVERLMNVSAAGSVATDKSGAGTVAVSVLKGATEVDLGKSEVEAQGVTAKALATTDFFDVVGNVAVAFSGTALGGAIGATIIAKRVLASLGDTKASENVLVQADNNTDASQILANVSGSAKNAFGGQLGALVYDNEVTAKISDNAIVTTDHSVAVLANDLLRAAQIGGAVSGGGQNAAGAAINLLVVNGTTKAEIGQGASVQAKGQGSGVRIVKAQLPRAYDSQSADALEAQTEQTNHSAQGRVDSFLAAIATVGKATETRNSLETYIGKTENSELVKGVSVAANGQQRMLQMALAGAGGGKVAAAGAIGVAVVENQVIAKVADNAKVNSDILAVSNAGQRVVVRALNSTKEWKLLASGAGGGTAGVGGGIGVSVNKASSHALVGQNAQLYANNDIDVNADSQIEASVVNIAGAGGGTAGIGGVITSQILSGTTKAEVKGKLDSKADINVTARETLDQFNVSGAGAGGGTAGIGFAISVQTVNSDVEAILDAGSQVYAAKDLTLVGSGLQDLTGVTVAGAGGGTAGIAGSFNISIVDRNAKALAKGNVRAQNMAITAADLFDSTRVTGAIAGGGTAGVGVGVNVAVLQSRANAGVDNNGQADLNDSLDIVALTKRNIGEYTIAGAGGGVAGVAGAISVLVAGAYGSKEQRDELTTSQGAIYTDVDNKSRAPISVDNTGDDAGDVIARALAGSNAKNDGTSFTQAMTSSSADNGVTQAFIGQGARVSAGDDVSLTSQDKQSVLQVGGAAGVGGVAGVGATVAVNVFDTQAKTVIAENARVDVADQLNLSARSDEAIKLINFAGGVAGKVGVGGVVAVNVVTSTAKAEIKDGAQINKAGQPANSTQTIALQADGDSKVLSIVAGLGGGLVGVGASVVVNTLNKQVVAETGAADLQAKDDILLKAKGETDVKSLGFALSGGAVAVSGLVHVNTIANEYSAQLGGTALAEDSINIEAIGKVFHSNTSISAGFGLVAVGGMASVNSLENITRARVKENARVTALGKGQGVQVTDTSKRIQKDKTQQIYAFKQGGDSNDQHQVVLNDAKSWGGITKQGTLNLSLTQKETDFGTRTVKGLSLVADSHEDLLSVRVSAGAGGVGISATGGVDKLHSTNLAEVARLSQINADNTQADNQQGIHLSALSKSEASAYTVGIAVGAVAVSGSVQDLIFNKTVTANMTASQAQSKGEVKVQANSENKVDVFSVAGAVGGSGGSGVVSLATVEDKVLAQVAGGLDAAELAVTANADSRFDGSLGGLGIGAAKGGALTVSDNQVKTSVRAGVAENASLELARGLMVEADNQVDFNTKVLNAGVAGVVGVAGAFNTNVARTQTQAFIADGTRVNQTKRNNQQAVSLSATDKVKIDNKDLNIAGGLAGGVGISAMKLIVGNQSEASIGDRVQLNAEKSLSLEADSSRQVDYSSLALGVGGLVAGSGTLSQIQLGGKGKSFDLDQDTRSEMESARSGRSLKLGEKGEAAKQGYGKNAAALQADAANQVADFAAQLTGEQQDSTRVSIGHGVLIKAGATSMRAKDELSITSKLTGISASLGASMGGWVSENSSAHNSVVELGSGDYELASLDVNSQQVTRLNAESTGVGVGLIGGVSDVVVNNKLANNSVIKLADGANITSPGQVRFFTKAKQDVTASTTGVQVGTIAAGKSEAKINNNSDAKFIAGNGRIDAAGITVQAANESSNSADALGGVGGAIGIAGAFAHVAEGADSSIELGNGAEFIAKNKLQLATDNKAGNKTKSSVYAGGIAAAGAAITEAKSSGDSRISTGANALLQGQEVKVNAGLYDLAGKRRADALGQAAGGGAIAGLGSKVKANIANDAEILLGTGSKVISDQQDITLNTFNKTDIRAEALGISGGAAAVGINSVDSIANNKAKIHFGSGVQVTSAKDLQVENQLDSQAYAESFALGGGVVAAGISGADVTVNNLSQISGDSGPSKLTATSGNATFTADNKVSFDYKVNAGGYGLVGGGKSNVDNDIRLTTDVLIGAGNQVKAGDKVSLLANSKVRKDQVSGNNVSLNAYGAISGASAKSDNQIDTLGTVSVGNGAQLSSVKDTVLSTTFDVAANDKVKVGTGGAGALASGKTQLKHNNTSLIALADNAKIAAGENLQLFSQGLGVNDAKGSGHAYGGLTSLRVDAITHSESEDKIKLGQGAQLTAQKDIYLGAGEKLDSADIAGFSTNNLQAFAKVISVQGSAVGMPSSNTNRAQTSQHADIDIASGAELRSGRNVTLAASAVNSGAVSATNDVRNYSVGAVFGGLKSNKGVSKLVQQGQVTHNGAIETGIARNVELAFKANGDVVKSDRVTDSNYDVHSDRIVIDGIQADLGDVFIQTSGDPVKGNGQVITPVNASISVINHTEKDLEVRELYIDPVNGGNFYVNGVRQHSDDMSKAAGGLSYADSTPYTAKIAVLNTHGAKPKLTVLPGGKGIHNVRGDVAVANLYGSVTFNGDVRARNLNVFAGESFRLNQPGQDVNVGSDPAGEYKHLQDQYEFGDGVNLANVSSSSLPARGSILAAGNIDIEAEKVNINGLVQSGIDTRKLVVKTSGAGAMEVGLDASVIAKAKASGQELYHLNSIVDLSLSGKALMDKLSQLGEDDLQQIPVYYDTKNDRLVVKDMDASGGKITIKGALASTGRGEIKALDGYSSFEIDNRTDKTLELSNISLGAGSEGSITLIDQNKKNSRGQVLVSRFVRGADGVVRKYTNEQTDAKTGLAIAGGEASSGYQVKGGQRYQWQQSYDKSKYKTYIRGSDDGDDKSDLNSLKNYVKGKNPQQIDVKHILGHILSGGDDWGNIKSERNVLMRYIDLNAKKEKFSVDGGAHNGLSGPFNRKQSDGRIVDSSVSGDFVMSRSKSSLEQYSNNKTEYWGGNFGDGYDKYVLAAVETKVVDSYKETYSVDASKSIKIGFFGQSESKLDIDSHRDILVTGLVSNPTGQTNITSQNGKILSQGEGVIRANQLNLKAENDYIGDFSLDSLGDKQFNSLNIHQVGENALLNATGKKVFVNASEGSLRVGDVKVTNSTIQLSSNRDIELTKAGVLEADDFYFKSGGVIKTANADNKLIVNTKNGGAVSVEVGEGNLNLEEASGDLVIKKLTAATGDIKLKVEGDLIDGAKEQSLSISNGDFVALTNELRLKDNAHLEQVGNTTVAAIEQSTTSAYHEYWQMRGEDNYNPDYQYQSSAIQRQQMFDAGYSTVEIAAYQDAKTEKFHRMHRELDTGESYDKSFQYVLSGETREKALQGLKLDVDELINNAVNAESLAGNPSQSAEKGNISGQNVSLDIGGNIGKATLSPVELPIGADGKIAVSQLSTAQRAALAQAEAGDLEWFADKVVVRVRNDVGVDAKGVLNLVAKGNAFVDTRESIAIETFNVGGEGRIKASGDITNARTDGQAVMSGDRLTVSSAGGEIGSAAKAFTMDTSDTGSVSIRTSEAAYVAETEGDLRLRDAGGAKLELTSLQGSIVKHNGFNPNTVSSEDAKLIAAKGIGSKDNRIKIDNRSLTGVVKFDAKDGVAMDTDAEIITIGDTKIDKQLLVDSAKVKQIRVEAGAKVEADSYHWTASEQVNIYSKAKVIAHKGDVVVNVGSQAENANPGNIKMYEGSQIDAGAHRILMTASGDIQLAGLTTQNEGADAVRVIAAQNLKLIDVISAKGGVQLTATTGEFIQADTSRLVLAAGKLVVNANDDIALGNISAGGGAVIESVTGGIGQHELIQVSNGKLSLSAHKDIALNAKIESQGLAAINLISVDGDISQGADADISSVDSDISMQAKGKVSLANIAAGSKGAIYVRSESSDILVGGNISSEEGPVFLGADQSIQVNGTISSEKGDISLEADNGEITQDKAATMSAKQGGVSITANGDIVLASITTGGKGAIEVRSTSSDIRTQGLLRSLDGAVRLVANRALMVEGDIITAKGAIELTAENGTLNQSRNADINTSGGSVRIKAKQNIALAGITARGKGGIEVRSQQSSVLTRGRIDNWEGKVSIFANQSVVVADTIRSLQGDIELVAQNGEFSQAKNADISTSNASVTIRANGNVVLENITTGGQGGLDVRSVSRDIHTNGKLVSVDGPVSLTAANSVFVNSSINTRNGDISARADNGSVIQAGHAEIKTGAGNVVIRAKNSVDLANITAGGQGTVNVHSETSNILVQGKINTLDGKIRLVANQSVLVGDNVGSREGDIEFVAENGKFIQTQGADIHTDKANVAIQAKGPVLLANITTGSQGAINARSETGDIKSDGQLTSEHGAVNLTAGQSVTINGAISTDLGPIGLVAESGEFNQATDADISSASAGVSVNAKGRVRLANISAGSIGAIDVLSQTSDIQSEGKLSSQHGAVKLMAGQSVAINGAVSSDFGPIELVAENGEFNQAMDADISSANAGVSVNAKGKVRLANISTGSIGAIDVLSQTSDIQSVGKLSSQHGAVKLVAGQSVAINGAISTDLGPIELVAENGEFNQAMDADISSANAGVSVNAKGKVRLANISTGSIGAIDVLSQTSDIQSVGKLSSQHGSVKLVAGQSVAINGAISTDLGPIELVAENGEFNQAMDADISSANAGVSVNAMGKVRLANISTGSIGAIDVQSQTSDIQSDGKLNSQNGKLRLVAAQSVQLNDTVRTGFGAIELVAENGELSQTKAADIVTVNADVSIKAKGKVLLGNINTGGQGAIYAHSQTSNIQTDGKLISQDGQLSLVAGQSLSINELISTARGDISLIAEKGELLQRRGADIETTDASIVMQAEGKLSLASVSVGGEGKLKADSRQGKIDVNQLIMAENGAITLAARDAVNLDAGIKTKGAGAVKVISYTNEVTQAVGTVLDGGLGDVQLRAHKDVLVREIKTAGKGDVQLISETANVQFLGPVTTQQGDIAAEADVDINITTARLHATGDGDIRLTAVKRNVNQDYNSSLAAGFGKVIIRAGHNANTTYIFTRNPGRFAIQAVSQNKSFSKVGFNRVATGVAPVQKQSSFAASQGRINWLSWEYSEVVPVLDKQADVLLNLKPQATMINLGVNLSDSQKQEVSCSKQKGLKCHS